MKEKEEEKDAPTIGILGGTGNLGRGLALRLADSYDVIVIGSRDTRERLRRPSKNLCRRRRMRRSMRD
jgi:predicted dinucleotide-binding enzyme